MTNDEAWWWLAVGQGSVAAGLALLRMDDPGLAAMWGVCFTLLGGVGTVVGAGVLMRLWK